MRKSQDIIFGKQSEDILFNQIEPKFVGLKKTKKYSEFDFETPSLKIELKSRTFNHDKYPTTMIGYNKILKCDEEPNFRYLFIFKFLDKILYCEYDKDIFLNFEIRKGGRKDRGTNEIKDYLYIPIDYLQHLDSLQNI